jgi:hypothetical protein
MSNAIYLVSPEVPIQNSHRCTMSKHWQRTIGFNGKPHWFNHARMKTTYQEPTSVHEPKLIKVYKRQKEELEDDNEWEEEETKVGLN